MKHAWRPNNKGFLAEDALTQSCPERKISVIWLLQITKFYVKKVDRGTIIDKPWWYKTWQPSGYSPTRVKRKLPRRPRNQMNFLDPTRKPKVIYTDNSVEFGKSCEEYSWNHCTSTPHRSETNGMAERAVRRVREATSAVLLQSGLDNERWADSMECYCHLRIVQDKLFWLENTLRKAVRNAL